MTSRLENIGSRIDLSNDKTAIVNLLNSSKGDERLTGLMTIRKKIELENDLLPDYFNLTKSHLKDPDNDCKWQSFIIIGSYMEMMPNEIWQLIIEFGNDIDADTRAAVATILLEHYFELHPVLFKERFQELKKEISFGKKNLLDTLKLCYPNWGSDQNKMIVERYISEN